MGSETELRGTHFVSSILKRQKKRIGMTIRSRKLLGLFQEEKVFPTRGG